MQGGGCNPTLGRLQKVGVRRDLGSWWEQGSPVVHKKWGILTAGSLRSPWLAAEARAVNVFLACTDLVGQTARGA